MTADARPIRIVFFGSGAFGLPTLEHLHAHPEEFEIVLVVSQPDRPAGRKRRLTPTPVAEWAQHVGMRCIRPERVNEGSIVEQVRSLRADAFVVIAFGQKIGPTLMEGTFSINLHGSLLPAYRGAAPIQRAMMDGCTTTGVSVITLAQRMDAGDILASTTTPIREDETAGELHDRLAALGPDVVTHTLRSFRDGSLKSVVQDEALATSAPKLSKAEGTADFGISAQRVRARIHGLNPWPGCIVVLDGSPVRLIRVRDWPDESHREAPGVVLENLHVACGTGAIEIVEIQPEGGRAMTLTAYRHGRALAPKMQFTPQSLGT